MLPVGQLGVDDVSACAGTNHRAAEGVIDVRALEAASFHTRLYH